MQDAKLMSCENTPLLLIPVVGLELSAGSWPALAVIGTVPFRMSRMFIGCESYPVR